MCEIIALVSKKGGAGKTTTAAAMTARFTAKGYKVLVIDLDGQANLSYSMAVNSSGESILDVLTGEKDIKSIIQHTAIGDIIAANARLDLADIKLTGGRERNLILKRGLKSVTADYDFIILDTLPFFGVLTLNALAASTGVIIPAKADIFNLNMFKRTCDFINSARKALNPDLKLYGVLLTHFKANTKNTRELLELFQQSAQENNTRVFNSKIRETILIQSAQATQKDIFTFNANGGASQDYSAFIDELENLIKGDRK